MQRWAQAFLDELRPYVWRRHLDYWAIADIHSIKRQIHSHGGHAELASPDFDVKLGRGGIREIEFFTQVQQLILGGRFPALRAPKTKNALKAMVEADVIAPEVDGGPLSRLRLPARRWSTASRWSTTSRPITCRTSQ